MLNALIWSLRCNAQDNRKSRESSTYNHTCARSLSLCHGPPRSPCKTLRNINMLWERQRPMSPQSAQQLVSCFDRIYSHLEVLTQEYDRAPRTCLQTHRTLISSCVFIIIYEYTVRCVHICRYFIYRET